MLWRGQVWMPPSGRRGPAVKKDDASSAAAAAKSLQSCPTLCDPIDGSLPGSAVPGILQARTLEWVAISFGASKSKVKVKSLSRVRLLATPWTEAHQAPPSMGFSRQEYWSGLPLPSPDASSTANQLRASRRSLFTQLWVAGSKQLGSQGSRGLPRPLAVSSQQPPLLLTSAG